MDIVSSLRSDLAEQTYKRVNVPLGKPVKMNRELRAKTHGIATKSSESIGNLINQTNLDKNPEEFHDMYVKSHHHYNPGERVDRRYHNFSESSIFGTATPHDRSGGKVREVMDYPQPPIDNEKVLNFTERTKAKIGTVHDPIKDSMKLNTGHTFGYVELPDSHDVSYLLRQGSTDVFTQSRDYLKSIIIKSRLKLKSANWDNFGKIIAGLKLVENDAGKIDVDAFSMVLRRLNFPIDDDSVASILFVCTDSEGLIKSQAFLDLLDWKKTCTFDTIEITGEIIEKLNTARVLPSTSSQVHDKTINSLNTRDWKTYGSSSLRSDLPKPNVRRVDDTKNYGDEGNAGLLISPSICETFGVYQSDLYQKRSRGEIESILGKMGIDVDEDHFNQIWEAVADTESDASFADFYEAYRH